MSFRTRLLPVTLALTGLLAALPYPAAAQKIKDDHNASPLESLAFVSDRLNAGTQIEPVDEAVGSLDASVRDGWAAFKLGSSNNWNAYVDRRNGRVELAEGEGIAWIPGRGNNLTNDDVAALSGRKTPELKDLEAIARGFLPRVASLLGVERRLSGAEPGPLGPARRARLVRRLRRDAAAACRSTARASSSASTTAT